MTTAAELRDRIEERIGDTANETWSEALILQEINDAVLWLAGELARVPNAGFFKPAEETFTVAADTLSFDPTTLTGHSTYPFWEVNVLYQILDNGDEVQVDRAPDADFGKHRMIQKVAPDSRPVFRVRRTDNSNWRLEFLPLSSGQRTFRIEYVYQPATLVAGSTIPTPPRYDKMLEMRVQAELLAIRNQANVALEAKIQTKLAETINDIGQTSDMARNREMREGVGEEMFP